MKALWIYEQPSRLQQMGMNVLLGKRSVTSVSSNSGGLSQLTGGGKGGGWEAMTQPPAKAEASVCVWRWDPGWPKR